MQQPDATRTPATVQQPVTNKTFFVSNVLATILIVLYFSGAWPHTTWLGLISFFVAIVCVGIVQIRCIWLLLCPIWPWKRR